MRLRLVVHGAVQGVGFRPFIYHLAIGLHLNGWVCNTANGVMIETEGEPANLHEFLLRVGRDYPTRAAIHSLEPTFLDPVGFTTFEIRDSLSGKISAWISPDIATCDDCRRELLDPQNRRYRYPFINCTHCGPRYSIIERMPYDRINTSMHKFQMCPACADEYGDPKDRRFHAQPNACPVCGPHLQLGDQTGKVISERDEALTQALEMVRAGKILALKGLGGFHLIVDASNNEAVHTLRLRKKRQGKPFAVMFPDIPSIQAACDVSALEERLLTAPEAPIVLLRKISAAASLISPEVAPGNPYLGVMLPYSPLHILLLHEFGRPVVATSGNLAEETICTDEKEALTRLKGLADFFLIHDRPILRPVDDSVARVILDTEQIIRRSRGYAPLPVLMGQDLSPALAVGGHLKNCVAFAQGRSAFISQHIGDLETVQSNEAFHKVISDLKQLYRIEPNHVACDMHPDYHSTHAAREMGVPVTPVQHHLAHVLSCIADNEIPLPVLGVSWDGSGYGIDGTIWGGEFILVTPGTQKHIACFSPFPLPGGEAAVREPWRALLGALYGALGNKAFSDPWQKYYRQLGFSPQELDTIQQMLVKKINSPLTSSVGRLFDAVAALLGLCHINTFEGRAAMSLEFSLPVCPIDDSYLFEMFKYKDDVSRLILASMWDEILRDIQSQTPHQVISAKFHNMLVDIIVCCAKASGIGRVALTGGCFQNRYLTERAVIKLRASGFQAYWHQRVPSNDGGLALGQIMAAARENNEL